MTELPSESLFGDYGEWPGRDVLDSGGERLGGVREIYLDRETGQPEWVLVDVDGDTARFVPLADASVESTTIRVAHAAATIRNAPGIGAEPRIDQSEERLLYAHYGLGFSEDDSGSGVSSDDPQPHAPPETREQAPVAPPTAWGAPDADQTVAPDTTANGQDATTSWSDVAPTDTNEAPPPAEPPTPAELEKADIPEPPAATDRAYDDPPPFGTPEPAATERDEPSFAATTPPPMTPPDDTPSFATTTPPPMTPPDDTPSFATTTPPPMTPPDDAPLPPTPPTATEPDPVTPPPPSPADAGPRAWTPPPPAPEPTGGALDVIKSRRGKIAVGVVVAAVLFMIIRKLR